MTKLTTERLETIATWREKYGNSANVMIPAEEAELMARQILAYEQAAKNPVAWVATDSEDFPEYNSHNEFSAGCGAGTPLYAAPVLPKQPDGTLIDEGDKIIKAAAEKLVRCKGRYHSEQNYRTLAALFGVTVPDLPPLLSDEVPAQPVIPEQNDLSEKLIGLANHIASAANGIPFGWQDWADEIVTDLRSLASTAQPVIPRELRSFVTDADIAALHRFAECCDDPESGGHDLEKEQVQRLEKIGALQRSGRISYITDFGDYLISATAPVNAQPVSEPYKLKDGVADIRNSGVEIDADKIKAERDAINSPVIPDGSADTKRLNWLDAQNARLNEYYGTSYGWKFDANFQRNAMMLNDSNFPVMTVRQAIDEAMLAAAPAQESE